MTPAGDRLDEAGLLGEGMKCSGAIAPRCGVHPSDEGFNPRDSAARQLDLRLVEQTQFTLVHRPAQLGKQGKLVLPLRVRVGIVDGIVGIAALRGVHRGVGMAHQHVGVLRVRRAGGHADARAHVEGMLADHDRRFEGAGDFLGHVLGLVHRGVAEEHRELVAAQPRSGVPTCA
jgi:hypothetical protein